MKKLFILLCISVSQKQFAQLPTVAQLSVDNQVIRYFVHENDLAARIEAAFSTAESSGEADSLTHLEGRLDYLFTRGDHITSNELIEIAGLLNFSDTTEMHELHDSIYVNMVGMFSHFGIVSNTTTFADSVAAAYDVLYPLTLPANTCRLQLAVCRLGVLTDRTNSEIDCVTGCQPGHWTICMMGCVAGANLTFGQGMRTCTAAYIGCEY